jgi:ATP-dependent DNA helicase RecG
MCSTTDGFKIAEKDLELRGPGDIQGTRQSGALNFKLANIAEDRALLEKARAYAENLLEADHNLEMPQHAMLRNFLQSGKNKGEWSKIS